MIRLLLFFKRIAPFLLFIVLELAAFSIYYSQDSYQRARMLSISNFLTGGIHSKMSDVSNYFDLDIQNQALVVENARLHSELENLRMQIEHLVIDSISIDSIMTNINNQAINDFKVVKVINNSYTKPNNYITISSGLNQGIRQQMALFNSEGIVGYVKYCGENYSIAISLLNMRDFRTSGKVKNNNSLGSIKWNGINYNKVIMDEIPTHSNINRGDTIVTTEYSNIFPSGINIGVVDSVYKVTDVLKQATLTTIADMTNLTYLYAVELPYRAEREIIEEQAQ